MLGHVMALIILAQIKSHDTRTYRSIKRKYGA